MREALSEALVDSEAFIAQIHAVYEEGDDKHYHHTSKRFPCITFTSDDMQIKGTNNRPLYYTRDIESSEWVDSSWFRIRIKHYAP